MTDRWEGGLCLSDRLLVCCLVICGQPLLVLVYIIEAGKEGGEGTRGPREWIVICSRPLLGQTGRTDGLGFFIDIEVSDVCMTICRRGLLDGYTYRWLAGGREGERCQANWLVGGGLGVLRVIYLSTCLP